MFPSYKNKVVPGELGYDAVELYDALLVLLPALQPGHAPLVRGTCSADESC